MRINLQYLGGIKVNRNARQIVLVENPNPQSMASLILLKHYYLKRNAINRDDYKVYLRFRNKFMKVQKRMHGSLTCVYCGKSNLTANINSHNANGRSATLDHIIPLSLGGKKFDYDNCAVACLDCNQSKGAKTKEEFEKEML